MFYQLDVPDYRLEPKEKEVKALHVLTDYELWEIQMELAGKWVPSMREKVYFPYDDDIDCWSEVWNGNITQQEFAEDGTVFSTANEAIAYARQRLEAALYA